MRFEQARIIKEIKETQLDYHKNYLKDDIDSKWTED